MKESKECCNMVIHWFPPLEITPAGIKGWEGCIDTTFLDEEEILHCFSMEICNIVQDVEWENQEFRNFLLGRIKKVIFNVPQALSGPSQLVFYPKVIRE